MADYEKPPMNNIDYLRDLAARLAGKANQLEANRERATQFDIGSPEWNDCLGIGRGVLGEAEYAIRLAHLEMKERIR
jgi:hypothetical protein